MAAYPSVNWWPGNLRLYESRLSFVARFCTLNGISVRKCASFLSLEPDSATPLPIDEIRRLTSVLGESAPLVKDVFSPSIWFVDIGRYGPAPERRERRAIRYCETCAQRGYHTYLHQLGWLSRCPFHLSDLKMARTQTHTGSLVSQRVGVLESVMRQYCKIWPYGVDVGFTRQQQRRVASLAGWVARASATALRTSHGEIWSSGADSREQAFDQLRTLEPPPEDIEPLLIEPASRWRLESHAFARQAKVQLDHLRLRQLGFAEVLHFYVRVTAASANPPSFIARLNAIQNGLKTQHHTCCCRWRRADAGWLSHWNRVRADEGRRWGLTCPYDIALDELRLGWGRSDLSLSNRQAEQERWRFCSVSHEILNAGLIRYSQEARVESRGHLCADQDVWACCEWVRTSPLTELLDFAVSWETELASDALLAWLNNIDRGADPFVRDDPGYGLHLCDTGDGLSLSKWTRTEGSSCTDPVLSVTSTTNPASRRV